jgi:hypothetical protein
MSLIPIQVTLGSLTSVVVTDGVVVASPQYTVNAPATGIVSFDQICFDKLPSTKSGIELATVDGKAVTMPATGTLSAVLVPDKAEVTQGLPLLTISYAGFGITTAIPVDDQYRLYTGPQSAKVNITAGPGGIACPVVTPPVSLEPAEGVNGSTVNVPVLCLLPEGTSVVAGLSARVGITTGSRTNVPVIPVGAVSGRAGQGEVTKINADGSRQVVTVGLGMTDGVNIEVTSGLTVGDTIAAIAPGLG